MSLAAGTRLGRYEIVGLLGAGGMGEVYRARDEQLRRDVAIKVLPASFSSDPDRLRRFEQEAQAAGSLNHPNILAIHDVGRLRAEGASADQGSELPFLVMEYLDGETLHQRLVRGALSIRSALDAAVQVAHGLSAAHDKGIVHRDLKPENLFITTDGRVKILDFGLAKLSQPEPVAADVATLTAMGTLTEAGAVLGTVGYMSPEQVKGTPADHRSDIFSFGVILYEMLAGRRAFARGSPVETMSAILSDEPPAIWTPPSATGTNPGTPVQQSVDRVVRRCLEKRPEDRFQSARDLAFALTEVGSTLSTPPSSTPRAVTPRRRAGWIAAAAAAAIAILVAVLGPADLFVRQGTGDLRITSLAVLPLENISNDPEQEYFSDGMTEALISEFARVGALRVISRWSVMTYKSKDSRKPLREIGRELNVDALIEGSVMRSGDRVRISTKLIDSKTERLIWANTYEGDLRDVLALQGQVARAVAREISITLTPQEEARLAALRPVHRESHEAYLRGRFLLGMGTERAIRQAIAHFNQAIVMDPTSALPHAGLSDAYAALRFAHLRPNVVMPHAKAAAAEALRLDPSLAEGHVSMAVVLMSYEFDWPGAEKALTEAIRLSPNLADAHHYYALYLAGLGRHAEARAAIDQAEKLDPLSLLIMNSAGFVAYLAGDYQRMIDMNQKAIDVDPNFWFALRDLGLGYERVHRFADAVAWLQKAKQIEPSSSVLEMLAGAYAAWGKKEEAQKVLAELHELAGKQYVCAYEVATVHAGLGDKAAALKWLEEGYKERADCMAWAGTDPKLDGMRGDPQFEELMERMGLARQRQSVIKR